MQVLSFEHITKLFKEHAVLEAQSECLLQGKACLVQTLLAILETENGVERPDHWVQIVENVGLCDGVFGRSKLIQPHQTQAEIEPGVCGHALFAHLHKDSLGIFPRLALGVDYSQSLCKQLVLWRWLDPQSIDVALFTVKQIVHAVEGVAPQDPGLLVARVCGEELVESLCRLAIVLLQDTDLGLRHEVTCRALVLDIVKNLASDVEDSSLQQEVNEIEEE